MSQGLRKQLGDGSTVSVWVDVWIEGDMKRRPLMKNILVDLMLMVDQLVDTQNNCWNRDTGDEDALQENQD